MAEPRGALSWGPFSTGHSAALQQTVRVAWQRRLAKDTYCLRLESPEIALRIVPGQFFMVRPARSVDPLLGRPFALYDTVLEDGEPNAIEFGYTVVGKLTSLMPTWKAGEQVQIWGPLGNGFPLPRGNHLMLVAGGIGQTPFLAVAREALRLRTYGRPSRIAAAYPSRVSLCYGVRSSEYLAGLEDFSLPGLDLGLATDDGTRGHHGFVTDLLGQSLAEDNRPDCVYCCGPEPMMHAAARICERAGVECWLSLETPMACGFGACFSCVTPVKIDAEIHESGQNRDAHWDYRRTCVEGPVLPADRLVF